jgi:hypothetical protein
MLKGSPSSGLIQAGNVTSSLLYACATVLGLWSIVTIRGGGVRGFFIKGTLDTHIISGPTSMPMA